MSADADLAPLCERFFGQWLRIERKVSENTVGSYAQCFRLFLKFIAREIGVVPSRLSIASIDAALVSRFLQHLGDARSNSTRSLNARLAAIRSFFRYCQLECPEHSARIQRILAVPGRQTEKRIVCYLTEAELSALLDAFDRETWRGRRNHAVFQLMARSGLRIAEATRLKNSDISLGLCACVTCIGKGRKERVTPLAKDVTVTLRAWMKEQNSGPDDILFPNAEGLELSSDALQCAIKRASLAAADKCESIRSKRVTPHVLRHSAAMRLAEAGVDVATIAALLGHESIETTMIYVEPTLEMKRKALEKGPVGEGTAFKMKPGDKLLGFLTRLCEG